jgi:hypothetical protein
LDSVFWRGGLNRWRSIWWRAALSRRNRSISLSARLGCQYMIFLPLEVFLLGSQTAEREKLWDFEIGYTCTLSRPHCWKVNPRCANLFSSPHSNFGRIVRWMAVL